jgi:dihydrofolate reductase
MLSTVNIIASVGPRYVIGYRGKIPWSLSNNVRRSQSLVKGHVVLIGRKTWESSGRKPIPDCTTVVITRDPAYAVPEGVVVIHDLCEAPRVFGVEKNLFVIGGEEVFRAFLPVADRLYLTEVNVKFKGDAFFPPYEESFWHNLESPVQGVVDAENPYPHRFRILRRCR